MIFKNSNYTYLDGKLYVAIEARSDVPVASENVKYFLSEKENCISNTEHFILQQDLKNLFSIRTFAVYQECRVNVFNFRKNLDGTCCISTENNRVSDYLDMQQVGKNLFNKIVNISELEIIWEVREPLLYYKLPYEITRIKVVEMDI